MALSSGNFPIYVHNSQFYFDTELIAGGDFEFNLTTPTSGDMGIFLNGTNTVSSNINLYSRGIAESSGVLSISMPSGSYLNSGDIPLYIDNRVPDSGNINIYSRGLEEASGDISIWSEGSIANSGNINVYSFGAYLESGHNLPTFVEGHVIFPIYTLGGNGNRPAGNIYNNIPIYIGNNQPSGSTILEGESLSIYTDAPIAKPYNDTFPIYTLVDVGENSGVLPIAINSKPIKETSSYISMYIPATESSGVMGGKYEFMNLFSMGYYGKISIIRDTSWEIASGSLPIYTESDERAMINMYTKCGPFGSSGDITTYIISAYEESGNLPMYVSSDNFERSGNIILFVEARPKATIPMYIHSSANSFGNIGIYQNGIISNENSSIGTYLYGNQPISSTIWTYFHGF